MIGKPILSGEVQSTKETSISQSSNMISTTLPGATGLDDNYLPYQIIHSGHNDLLDDFIQVL